MMTGKGKGRKGRMNVPLTHPTQLHLSRTGSGALVNWTRSRPEWAVGTGQ